VSGSLDDRCQKYENIDRRCDHFFVWHSPHSQAQGYVVGMYDMAAHAAYSIDGMRHFGAMPNNDAEVEFALDRVVDFCKPEHATVKQMTDVFCAHLKNKPAERHGLPSIIFNEA
jgi:hypothetical protein